MKHPESVNKLVKEMVTLIDVIRENKQTGEMQQLVMLKTGDVLGALEVFTFANFTDKEQEVIFSRARKEIEGGNDEEAITITDNSKLR
jgi:hypothetical protein